ncbi:MULTISPECIES: 5-formyltetrahydrofolate cyclo-ligase [unclassified Thioclava]|uniref:5-formyltetrahydrofolate cyclo-ligase n=1 Tax=unclassified Thioclava TaxID=2621713 RepID=UPI0009987B93|nr:MULTISPECIES: 5-formyltetrahydrofolate cyclo-ligase [unclassified Thioclava]MAQ36030.1 5-formyltetrahydrofolate cyclo-ligase [Thioclava sp.]OOY06936.1 5-formyltetrahydrofolate cyclo-ligase [Thioclava sp. F36-7]OOY14998.1 5-formyltetrahydrofolate cyclo-ligase [Thioclava sp. DLFJ4-1]
MDDDATGGASACFAHLLVDGHLVDPETARDVARFRRAERARLVAARALSAEDRERATDRLIDGLDRIVPLDARLTVAVYWPIRGEPDLRGWMGKAHEAGAEILLPVVIERDAPLEFHTWSPECQMVRGIWNIPVPAAGEPRMPDIVIVPLVGVDTTLHRLGNGGGYYDRTLVRFEKKPRIVGIGFSGCVLSTIYPMPWDVPMDEILLSDGTHLTR